LRYSKRDRRPRPTNKPLRSVPAASTPATYDGARLCRDGSVVMRWQAECGTVDVVYPYQSQMTTPIQTLEEPIVSRLAGLPDTWKDDVNPDNAVAVVVGPGFHGNQGPELTEYAPDRDHKKTLLWTMLAGILGRPVPFWTYHLQDVEVLLSWRPGDAPVEVPVQPDLDTDPLTRLAGTLPPDSAAWKALMYLVWSAYSSDSAAQWLKDAAGAGGDDVITFPLQPMAAHRQVNLRDLPAEDQTVMRVGWREILERRDGLARGAVRAASFADIGPQLFPYSLPIELPPEHRFYTEINDRLTPSAWTAGHERPLRDWWFQSSDAEPLWDPITDTPALRLPDGDLRVMSPHGTLAPITEAILIERHQVWMRTDEKHIIPPPQNHNLDMKYGYSGGGTAAFEQFLKAWLKTPTPHTTDIQAERCTNALASITDHTWPVGTTINRDQVQLVLNGEPAQHVIG